MPLVLGLLILLAIVIVAFWLTANVIGVLFTLLVAGVVGWLADLVVPGDFPFGWLGAIIAGLVGSWIGVAVLGDLGPSIAGIAIIPAFIGAVVLAFVVDLLLKAFYRRPAV